MARSTAAADPTKTGIDTSWTEPLARALTATSGPIPAGSPIIVPTTGLRGCDATAGSDAVNIEHSLGEIVDDNRFFALDLERIADRDQIVMC